MRVLTVNAGSSSVKLRLLGHADEVLVSHDLAAQDSSELRRVAGDLDGQVDGIGHRIVHGGPDFQDAVLLDDEVRHRLSQLAELAPLHQRAGLAEADLLARMLPGVPAVMCFDTTFHATLPAAAATIAVPAVWREQFGIRRYGFHGLAHASVLQRVTDMRGGSVPERLIVCHLGSGASLAAVRDGRSIDTTMSFTPLDGLVMATRSGSVDPGALIWLQTRGGLSVAELSDALEHHSGLAGLAGTADMREVIAAASDGDDRAQLALDVYLHRLRAGIAEMAAALGGVEVIAFSGGVGEHAPEIRQRTCGPLGFLGVGIDPELNAQVSGDAEITAGHARVRTYVVTAREDLQIAAQVRGTLR